MLIAMRKESFGFKRMNLSGNLIVVPWHDRSSICSETDAGDSPASVPLQICMEQAVFECLNNRISRYQEFGTTHEFFVYLELVVHSSKEDGYLLSIWHGNTFIGHNGKTLANCSS